MSVPFPLILLLLLLLLELEREVLFLLLVLKLAVETGPGETSGVFEREWIRLLRRWPLECDLLNTRELGGATRFVTEVVVVVVIAEAEATGSLALVVE